MCLIHLPLNTALVGFEKEQTLFMYHLLTVMFRKELSVTCTFLSLVVHYFEAK